MHKAIEYEVKYDQRGRAIERRWSVGPVLITTAATVMLTLHGHTIWNGIAALLKVIKWW